MKISAQIKQLVGCFFLSFLTLAPLVQAAAAHNEHDISSKIISKKTEGWALPLNATPLWAAELSQELLEKRLSRLKSGQRLILVQEIKVLGRSFRAQLPLDAESDLSKIRDEAEYIAKASCVKFGKQLGAVNFTWHCRRGAPSFSALVRVAETAEIPSSWNTHSHFSWAPLAPY